MDYSFFYVIILLCSCVFVFAVFEIYFDRKKNLWNFSGPFPLPLIGKDLNYILYFLIWIPLDSKILQKL